LKLIYVSGNGHYIAMFSVKRETKVYIVSVANRITREFSAFRKKFESQSEKT